MRQLLTYYIVADDVNNYVFGKKKIVMREFLIMMTINIKLRKNIYIQEQN